VDLRVNYHHGGGLSLDGGKRCLGRVPLAGRRRVGRRAGEGKSWMPGLRPT
jgi:hypothetical protein